MKGMGADVGKLGERKDTVIRMGHKIKATLTKVS